MRMEHEHMPPAELLRPGVDQPDTRVAILHRRGKLSALKRRAHAGVFGEPDPPLKDKRFGTAADAAVSRADQHLVCAGTERRFGSDFPAARLGDPERAWRLLDHSPILSLLLRGIQ